MLLFRRCFPILAGLPACVLGFAHQAKPSRPLVKLQAISPPDISDSLISNLAEIAIKLRLAGHVSVECEVSSTPTDLLLGGKIGPVAVRGSGWRSPLGLTCRRIEAKVQTCELDIGRIVSSRKLVLTRPAEGKCMIALNKEDWGNFITHPLMQPPMSIVFLKDEPSILVDEGSIVFFAEFRDQKCRCTLERIEAAERRAKVSAEPVNPRNNSPMVELDELSSALTVFFNDLAYELDGTFLSFRDMLVTDKGSAPCVMLALNILVRKFPSPGVDF